MNPALPQCEMSVIDREAASFWGIETKRCPNRAKLLVVCAGWTQNMCRVHGNPYRRELLGRRVTYVKSVTELEGARS